MGPIIYWGLVRFSIVLVAAWLLYGHIPEYTDWWTMFFVAVGVVVVYPAQLQWRKYMGEVRAASRNGLCATCRYFGPREALCRKLDEHVREDYTPCGGQAWEPASIDLTP